jgi:hypothetical protein
MVCVAPADASGETIELRRTALPRSERAVRVVVAQEALSLARSIRVGSGAVVWEREDARNGCADERAGR